MNCKEVITIYVILEVIESYGEGEDAQEMKGIMPRYALSVGVISRKTQQYCVRYFWNHRRTCMTRSHSACSQVCSTQTMQLFNEQLQTFTGQIIAPIELKQPWSRIEFTYYPSNLFK